MDPQSIDPTAIGIPSKIGNFKVNSISWKDFQGKGPDNCWFLSHIYWAINYDIVPSNNNNKPKVKVDTKILPKSWVNHQAKSYKLLRHQYGHYLIGCLCALSFEKKVNITRKQPTEINFNDWCRAILRQTLAQYQKIQKQYDVETYHYLNEKQQQQWNKEIVRQLNEHKIDYDMREKEQQNNKPKIIKNSLPKIAPRKKILK